MIIMCLFCFVSVVVVVVVAVISVGSPPGAHPALDGSQARVFAGPPAHLDVRVLELCVNDLVGDLCEFLITLARD